MMAQNRYAPFREKKCQWVSMPLSLVRFSGGVEAADFGDAWSRLSPNSLTGCAKAKRCWPTASTPATSSMRG